MKKKVLCLILVVSMVFSMISTTAFATDGMTLTLDDVSVDTGTQSITVNMNVVNADAFCTMGIQLSYDTSALTLTSVAFGEVLSSTGGTLTPNVAGNSWLADWSTDVTPSDGVAYVLTFSVSDEAAGEYKIEASLTNAGCNNFSLADVELTFEAGTITVGTTSTDPYTANISTTATEFTVDETVEVTVTVGGTVGSFASSEVTLTYDSTYLTFNQSASTLNGAGVDLTTTGTIKLVDHGETNAYPAAYVLNFTANQDTGGTTTPVEITYAAFSTANDAVSEDLTVATGLNTLDITIEKAEHSVDLDEAIFESNDGDTVTDGDDYTFEINSEYYDYKTVTIKMGDDTVTATWNEETGEYEYSGDAFTVTESNGTWTVVNVTGDLEISGTRTGKIYNVTVTDNEHKDKVTYTATAQYGVAYTFTASDDAEDPDGATPGYYYKATTTVGGTEYTSSKGTGATIPGNKITGDFVITVTKETVAADEVNLSISNDTGATVTVKDKDSGETVGTTVKKNSTITVTLSDTEYGYNYFVNGDAYTDGMELSVGEVDVTLTVTREAVAVTGTVYKYLTLNGTTMWLITAGDATAHTNLVADGNVYTYGGEAMYWSTNYQAYCYLVVATEQANVSTTIGIASGTAGEIEYDMDVNQSGKVDMNDAQLIYNMYQTKAYTSFDDKATMRKFLEADLNASVVNGTLTNYGINVDDAQVVVSARLAATDR